MNRILQLGVVEPALSGLYRRQPMARPRISGAVFDQVVAVAEKEDPIASRSAGNEPTASSTIRLFDPHCRARLAADYHQIY
jgi:hypothetical protein